MKYIARIEAQSKLGYYPIPDTQLPLILTWLQLPAADLVRALDPCCGKGEALAYLAHGLGRVTTYGIELSYSRADEAERLLDHILTTGFENAVLTDGTFSFCLLNPPHDGETATGGGERLEGRFLLSTTPLLCENGVLVYIIPETRVDEGGRSASAIARHLAGWYADLRCFRFTEPDYQAFRQVVIFGRKKAYRQPTQEAVDEIRSWALGNLVTGYEDRLVPLTDDEILAARVEKAIGKKLEELQIANRVVSLISGQTLNKQNASNETLVWAMKTQAWLDAQPVAVVDDESTRPTKKVHVPVLADLPTLTAGSGEYNIPPSPVAGPKGQAFPFKHMPVTEEDYLRAADKAALALEKSRPWLNLIPEIESQTITTAITPKQGHISMLVTAGLLGTTLVTHNGFPLLLKGGTEKYTVKIDEDSEEEEIEYDPDDPDKKKSLFRVRVLFPTYENTLEERALNLIGQKMKAAQLFYGDEVASALCDDEEGDFLNDLILSVLKDDRLERANAIFSTQNDMTVSPLGSLTAASPHLNPFEARTWSEWLAVRNKALPAKNGRRKSAAAQGQLSLF